MTLQEDEWLARVPAFTAQDFKSVESALVELDAHLILSSHILGYSLTIADLAVWGALRGNRAAYAYIKRNALINLSRWFRYIESNPWVAKAVETVNSHSKEKK